MVEARIPRLQTWGMPETFLFRLRAKVWRKRGLVQQSLLVRPWERLNNRRASGLFSFVFFGLYTLFSAISTPLPLRMESANEKRTHAESFFFSSSASSLVNRSFIFMISGSSEMVETLKKSILIFFFISESLRTYSSVPLL